MWIYRDNDTRFATVTVHAARDIFRQKPITDTL